MFAVVYIPQFSLQAALRHHPELWSKPIALVDPARGNPVVGDVTDSARLRGVTEGMTPTQAIARCGELTIRHRSVSQETAVSEAVLQCSYGFSPNIEATAPGVCTLDLRGLAALSSGDPSTLVHWSSQLRTTLTGHNLSVRVGVGSTPNIACHAARWGTGIEIVSDPKNFIASLPLMALQPSTDVALILQKWGIQTVGEFLSLGQEALVERLGLEALALFAAASTTVARPLNLVRPSERFEEVIEFEDAIETVEPLLFVLRRFVVQLAQRIELNGLTIELLTLRLRLESGQGLERRFRIPLPTRQPDILFRMLHAHLETLRTDSPIQSLTLTASPCQPEQKQFGLFEVVLRDPHQFQETLARLAGMLGEDRVGNPVLENSHRSGTFRMVPPDFENAPAGVQHDQVSALCPVALRRFRPAVKASVEVESQGQTPVSIRSSAGSGKLKLLLGPWRSSGHWWEPGVWEQEEWDVSTSTGTVMRLVKNSDGWFVDGVLD